jgi:ABC-type transport system involved in Fe-S cluster assembly fused permease/ATPase subunit
VPESLASIWIASGCASAMLVGRSACTTAAARMIRLPKRSTRRRAGSTPALNSASRQRSADADLILVIEAGQIVERGNTPRC